jgi:oligopeptide transport system permease protein
MISFLLKRFAWMALTLWAVFTVSFWLMWLVPGGPLDSERAVDPVIQKNLEKRYNLDRPLAEIYLGDLARTLTGDLGYSYRRRDFTVNEIIASGWPYSAALGLSALVLAITFGLAIGIISAVYRGTFADVALRSVATIGIALPNFVIAGIMVLLFVIYWPIFPAARLLSPWHLVLPAICLAAPYAAYIARLVRTGMLDVLSQDYIRTARAKGLPARRVILRHALRGALLPVVSYLGPAIAGLLTGSLVIEQIFAIPGLGMHFIQAATQRDYTLAMGLVLLYTTLLYTMNLLVDISYRWLDPRVKLE